MESKEDVINMFKDMGESFIENNIEPKKTSDVSIDINWKTTCKRIMEENEALRKENEGLRAAVVKLASI